MSYPQLFMNTQKKPIKADALKIRYLIDNMQEDFLDKIEEVLHSQDELTFDGNTVIEAIVVLGARLDIFAVNIKIIFRPKS